MSIKQGALKCHNFSRLFLHEIGIAGVAVVIVVV